MSVLNLSWGSPIVDRRNRILLSSRVELPQSVIGYDHQAASTGEPARTMPILPRYVGILGFITCGAIVIATASFVALSF